MNLGFSHATLLAGAHVSTSFDTINFRALNWLFPFSFLLKKIMPHCFKIKTFIIFEDNIHKDLKYYNYYSIYIPQ